MITKANTERLNNIVAKLSYRDMEAHYKKCGKKCGYSLGIDTLEALELYRIAYRTQNGYKPTREEEESVKAYLLKRKPV